MDKQEKEKLLSELRSRMEKDTDLPLRAGTTNLVFGVGKADTELLFIGEGPGYWEDLKAEPFVGNAGKLLDTLLQSVKLLRQNVYITNVVHHRPPENRDPLPSEILAYGKYLDKIIEIIDPKIIVTLGRFSMGKFLPGAKISSVHGKPQVVHFNGKHFTVIPMYHPAAALRNPEVMRQEKLDFLKLPDIIKNVEDKEKEEKSKLEQMNLI